MEWVTKGALDFLGQCKDKPFYLHLATTLQHSPPPQKSIAGDPCLTPAGLLPRPLQMQAPRSTIAERLRQAGLPENMGHATWLDDGIAAVIQELERLGKLENTVIIFYSDNSTRGGKGTCYEGGAKTPAFVSWKSHFSSGVVCDKLIQNIDWVPTIFDLAGIQAPAQMKIDGQSLVPLAIGRTAAWRDAVFFEIGHARAVCTGRWKYFAVRYPPALQEKIKNNTLGRPPYHMDSPINLQKLAVAAHPAYWDADQLYDLQNDPDEKTNLIRDPNNAATVAQLKARLKEWLAGFNRPFGEFVP
jgi:arylsulfatase A-like enzyme